MGCTAGRCVVDGPGGADSGFGGAVGAYERTRLVSVRRERSLTETCVRRILQTRSFAAVLFRRIATRTRKVPGTDESKELFLTLQEAEKIAIRQKLLQCLGSEILPHVRNKIGDAVAEIARQYSEDGKWGGLRRKAQGLLELLG